MGLVSGSLRRMRLGAVVLTLVTMGSVVAPAKSEERVGPLTRPTHPMDALTADEITTAVDTLRKAGKFDDSARIVFLALDENPKQDVRAWKPGQPFARHGLATVIRSGHLYEAQLDRAVSLGAGMTTAVTAQAKPSDLVMMNAADLSDAIRMKRVSSREVMIAYLDRINSHVNAIVSLLDRSVLLAAADEADAAIAQGTYRGWMHGLPHAVKDLTATRGIRTTMGSPLFADWTPTGDAIFVERLRKAGAIIIGKTNTPEFGLGSQTYDSILGTTLNAYDQTKTAGGSSGGAAAAVALRMVPVADGSDFAGSLRNPSGWNNIYGLRPSAGRVPFGATGEVFMQQLGYEGPMGRNVSDLALLLSVMAGYDDRTPLSLTEPAAAFAEPLKRDVAGVKIGWLGDLGGIPMQAGMLDLCLSGLRRLEAAGCTIEQASLAISREAIWASFVSLRQAFLAGGLGHYYHDPVTRAKFKPEAIWEIEGGMKLSAVDSYAASTQRSAVYQSFRTLFERFDFVALPSALVFPFDAKVHWLTEVAGVAMDSYHRWMEIIAAGTLSGLPTISVPAGFGADGLPSGIQIIGPSRKDFAVLQIAYAYEQVSAGALSRLPALLEA